MVFLFVCGCFLPRYAGFVVLFCCFWSSVLVWFVLYDMGFFLSLVYLFVGVFFVILCPVFVSCWFSSLCI